MRKFVKTKSPIITSLEEEDLEFFGIESTLTDRRQYVLRSWDKDLKIPLFRLTVIENFTILEDSVDYTLVQLKDMFISASSEYIYLKFRDSTDLNLWLLGETVDSRKIEKIEKFGNLPAEEISMDSLKFGGFVNVGAEDSYGSKSYVYHHLGRGLIKNYSILSLREMNIEFSGYMPHYKMLSDHEVYEIACEGNLTFYDFPCQSDLFRWLA